MNTKNPSTALAANFGRIPSATKRPAGNMLMLQWFNELPAGKRNATGWHIQASRCPEELTRAIEAYGYERLTVKHKLSGKRVEYWSLETCSLIFLCNGFEDIWTMKASQEREGLAYGWIESKQHSKVKIQVIVVELAALGYIEPFVISLEGHITEEFLGSLAEQFRVLDAYEHLTGEKPPFCGFSLTMTPAEESKMVGKGVKQSPIIPMLAEVPEKVDAEYLENHLCPPEILQAIETRDLLGQAVRWSVETSRRISRGEDRESWETEAYEKAMQGAPADFLEVDVDEEEEQKATKQQLASIKNLCNLLGKESPEPTTFAEAKALMEELSAEFKAMKNGKANNKKS